MRSVRCGRAGQSRHVRQGQCVAAAVGRRQYSVVEQLGVAVSVQEPVFDRALERKISYAVRKEERSIAARPCRQQNGHQVRDERHQVKARITSHPLILPVIGVEQREVDKPSHRGPAEHDHAGIEIADAGLGEPFAV